MSIFRCEFTFFLKNVNLTSNLTSVTLQMRSRSNLTIYSGRPWLYCGGGWSHNVIRKYDYLSCKIQYFTFLVHILDILPKIPLPISKNGPAT